MLIEKFKITKKSSFNRCRNTVALVAGKFCINRLLERSVEWPDKEIGEVVAIWAYYVDYHDEYGPHLLQKYEFRMRDDLPEEACKSLKSYLIDEVTKESNEINDLRAIRRFLDQSSADIARAIIDAVRRDSYSKGLAAGRKPESGEDEFLMGLE